MKQTWPKFDEKYDSNMERLNFCFGAYVFFVIILISYMQFIAYKKHKKIQSFFKRINDEEFVALYEPITHWIINLC